MVLLNINQHRKNKMKHLITPAKLYSFTKIYNTKKRFSVQWKWQKHGKFWEITKNM